MDYSAWLGLLKRKELVPQPVSQDMKLGRPIKSALNLLWSRLRDKGHWGSRNKTVLTKLSLRQILGWCLWTPYKGFAMNEGGSLWQENMANAESPSDSVTEAQAWAVRSNAWAKSVDSKKNPSLRKVDHPQVSVCIQMNWTSKTQLPLALWSDTGW